MGSTQPSGEPEPFRRNQVVLFGGHGSSTIFSSLASKRARHDSQTSAPCSIFLSRCHAAFVEDCLRLGEESNHILTQDFRTIFQNRDNFLTPPVSVQNNAIVQAVTICLYQLLRYIAEADGPDPRLDPTGRHILEAVGICSGLLPSAVVATSRSTQDLIENGVAACRLAFYVAYRSTLHGRTYESPNEENQSSALIVTGISQVEADEKLNSFCSQVSEPWSNFEVPSELHNTNGLVQSAVDSEIRCLGRKYPFSDWTARRAALVL